MNGGCCHTAELCIGKLALQLQQVPDVFVVGSLASANKRCHAACQIA
jgi:hypothetical protein